MDLGLFKTIFGRGASIFHRRCIAIRLSHCSGGFCVPWTHF